MTTSCTTINPATEQNEHIKVSILEEYEPDIGSPFRVVLVHSVKQSISSSGEIIDTCIPNMKGLLREVALARSLHNRKFSPEDIKFVRKAIGLRANELSDLLGVSAEHLSRCENGDRSLSLAAEKLFRVIVLKRRYNYPALREKLTTLLDRDELSPDTRKQVREMLACVNNAFSEVETAIFESRISSVYDATEKLSFEFRLLAFDACLANDNQSQEDGEIWQRAA